MVLLFKGSSTLTFLGSEHKYETDGKSTDYRHIHT